MQGLRAEHDIHIRCAPDDRRTFLAGHTTADADQQIRIEQLQCTRATKVGKHFLLRLLTDRAGVEQNNIRLLRPVDLRHAFTGM